MGYVFVEHDAVEDAGGFDGVAGDLFDAGVALYVDLVGLWGWCCGGGGGWLGFRAVGVGLRVGYAGDVLGDYADCVEGEFAVEVAVAGDGFGAYRCFEEVDHGCVVACVYWD